MGEDGLITRRDFLRGSAAVTLGAALGVGISSGAWAEPGARVVLIRHAEALDGSGGVRQEVVASMLDEALKALFGEGDPLAAWGRLVRASDVVGIKSNSWHSLPTPKEMGEAIRRRLLDVGVAESNMGIDDRGVLGNPIFARATALINVCPVRTHFWSGVGGCLKNYIMFVPNPSAYHGDACSELGAIWKQPLVQGKTRLNVLVALTPQFYGRGPNFFDRRYVWPYKGIIVGTDPVAVDSVGAHLLMTQRVEFFGEDRPLDVPPKHMEVAEKKYGLGVSDLKRIELIKLGWMEGVLI